jgi:hypothetical protein
MNNSTHMYSLARERRKALLAVVISLATAIILMFTWWLPARERYKRLQSHLDRIEKRMTSLRAGSSRHPPWVRLKHAKLKLAQLEEKWEVVRSKADTFKYDSILDESLLSVREGRIDYEIALHKAETVLYEMAEHTDTALPIELGLSETVSSHPQFGPQLTMWQIATIVEILTVVMDHGAVSIGEVSPLEPVHHFSDPETGSQAYEIPLKLEFTITYSSLASLIDYSLSEHTFLAWRGLDILKSSPSESAPLRIQAILASECFLLSPGISKHKPADGNEGQGGAQ